MNTISAVILCKVAWSHSSNQSLSRSLIPEEPSLRQVSSSKPLPMAALSRLGCFNRNARSTKTAGSVSATLEYLDSKIGTSATHYGLSIYNTYPGLWLRLLRVPLRETGSVNVLLDLDHGRQASPICPMRRTRQ